MPRISVIVPVYNVEACLPFCVDSILHQTFSDFELILVDDGSSDKCGKMCEEYAEKDERVHVIHQKNGGLSAARNTGIDAAKGEFITFIDSDDAVTENFLERLLSLIENCNADISFCSLKEFSVDDRKLLNADSLDGDILCFDGRKTCVGIYEGKLPITACGKLFKMSAIGQSKFPVGRLHEDQAFIPPVCYRINRAAVVDEALYLYRVRAESITRTKFSVKRYDDIWAIDNCISFFEENNEPQIVEAAKAKRKRLLCVYSIYAKRDGVKIPEQYKVRILAAISYLRKNVSPLKYEYYLAQINPKCVRLYEYKKKIKKILHFN